MFTWEEVAVALRMAWTRSVHPHFRVAEVVGVNRNLAIQEAVVEASFHQDRDVSHAAATAEAPEAAQAVEACSEVVARERAGMVAEACRELTLESVAMEEIALLGVEVEDSFLAAVEDLQQKQKALTYLKNFKQNLLFLYSRATYLSKSLQWTWLPRFAGATVVARATGVARSDWPSAAEA